MMAKVLPEDEDEIAGRRNTDHWITNDKKTRKKSCSPIHRKLNHKKETLILIKVINYRKLLLLNNQTIIILLSYRDNIMLTTEEKDQFNRLQLLR